MTREEEINYFLNQDIPQFECDIFELFQYGKQVLKYKECLEDNLEQRIQEKLDTLADILYKYTQEI